MANPWIGDAAVLKLYPDRLQITVTERQAFAIWQKDGRVSVIAADGTVLEPFVERRYVGLPLVVGKGAEHVAKDFLAVIDRYPDIRSQLRASILVAERRWNLRLANGIDVRLPEIDVVAALDRLVAALPDLKNNEPVQSALNQLFKLAQSIPDWATPSQNQWSETAVTLLLAASAWIVAASLRSAPWGFKPDSGS